MEPVQGQNSPFTQPAYVDGHNEHKINELYRMAQKASKAPQGPKGSDCCSGLYCHSICLFPSCHADAKGCDLVFAVLAIFTAIFTACLALVEISRASEANDAVKTLEQSLPSDDFELHETAIQALKTSANDHTCCAIALIIMTVGFAFLTYAFGQALLTQPSFWDSRLFLAGGLSVGGSVGIWIIYKAVTTPSYNESVRRAIVLARAV